MVGRASIPEPTEECEHSLHLLHENFGQTRDDFDIDGRLDSNQALRCDRIQPHVHVKTNLESFQNLHHEGDLSGDESEHSSMGSSITHLILFSKS